MDPISIVKLFINGKRAPLRSTNRKRSNHQHYVETVYNQPAPARERERDQQDSTMHQGMITADTTTRTIQVTLSIVVKLSPEDPENPSLAAQQGWTLDDYSEEELRDALTPDVATLNAMLENTGLDLAVQEVLPTE
jgi:hypothetical protein